MHIYCSNSFQLKRIHFVKVMLSHCPEERKWIPPHGDLNRLLLQEIVMVTIVVEMNLQCKCPQVSGRLGKTSASVFRKAGVCSELCL